MADADRVKRFGGALEWSLYAFVAACFLLPTAPAYSLVFYLGVLPCLAACAPFPATGSAFRLGALLIVWSAATLLWGRNDGGRATSFAIATACTLAFWVALHAVVSHDRVRARLATLLVAAGSANAMAGIVRLVAAPAYQPPGEPLRLHGWGITYHPVLGAAALGICCLTALDRARRAQRRRAWYLAAATLLAVAIALTRSRGPALAVWAGAVALLALGPSRRWTPLLIGAPAMAWMPGLIRTGSSGHVATWRLAWTEIERRPLFGHGLAANLPATLGADKSFPHDLYLSLLFYSGGIGLALFIAWAAVLGHRLWAARAQPDTPWLVAMCINALVAGVTDFGQITKGPGPLWLIVWLPAGLVAGRKYFFFEKKKQKTLVR